MFISEMNLDKVGRIPPHTKRVVVRKANSHRDLRPLTERVTILRSRSAVGCLSELEVSCLGPRSR